MSTYAPHVDLLTGAYRRDYFEVELAVEVKVAQRMRLPLSLLWLNVDELCEHNDLHGRDALDGALGWVASKVSAVINGRGPIGRVEGGAFAVILPLPLDQSRALGERLRRCVPGTLHSSAFGDYRLTLSVGVAQLRRGEPWGNLVDAAESACCRAKQGGRDLVVAR